MSKTKWYTRAIYLVFALALVAGLSLMPAPTSEVAAAGTTCGCLGTDSAGSTAAWSTEKHSGTYSAVLTKTGSGSAGSTYVQFTPAAGTTLLALDTITAKEWSFWHKTPATAANWAQLELRFTGSGSSVVDVTVMALQGFTGSADWAELTLAEATVSAIYYGTDKAGTSYFYASGGTNVDSILTHIKANANCVDSDAELNAMVLTRVRIELWEADARTCNIDDVTINGVNYDLEPCYYLEPDLALNVKTADATFKVLDGCGGEIGETTTVGNWVVTKGEGAGEVTKLAGGAAAFNHTNDFITVRMVTTGDCIITCDVDYDGDGTKDVTLHAEKKWGELHHTILDVDASTTAVEHEKTVVRATNVTYNETLKDMVYAEFLELLNPQTAGGAVVNWWLFKDTIANQDAINDLMDDLAANNGFLYDNHWSATGQYDPDDAPIDAINVLHATQHATKTIWTVLDPAGTIYSVGGTNTYAKNHTEDDAPGDVRGRAQATLQNNGTDEKVMIVVLVDYPLDKHGENRICIEKGKKEFTTVTPPTPEQIKVPQVRWAGEKIVLEKEWGTTNSTVVFTLQGNSVGSLEAIYPADISASDAQTVVTTVQSDGVSRCILQSQPQGQADVKAALYSGVYLVADSFAGAMGQINTVTVPPQNHDFLVYFLALEDVTVDEELSELEGNDAGASANVTVQVRGWFTSNSLPGTSRPPVDANGDLVYELPAGRYVLPDDWAALAGSDLATSNKGSRPQYDLMNTPGAGVDSANELGPYDSGVRTTTPVPGKAEKPCIGPFNSLQPWSNFDALGNPVNKWIATASVVADYTVAIPITTWTAADLRNTVVPDTTIDESDCPMPQALVTFEVSKSTLIKLDKGNVFFSGSGASKVYTAPFYAMEIPSHWLIPVAGYFWDSWGVDGPYDFWTDLRVTPSATDDDILEVYSDNHGYAGVTIVGTGLADECVTLDVIADFPVMAAKYPAVETDTEVCWGEAVMHLDADFEVSARTGVAPITISFYGLKAAGTGDPWTEHGTPPYVKAEWDFDGNGTIDKTVVGATSALTLATQTFNFTVAGSYSPWLRVTDFDGLVDICQKPNYIVLTGPVGVLACDINESGTVNITDFVLFATAYGSFVGDANWDARCDLNGTNGVDILDFVIFAQCYIAHAE